MGATTTKTDRLNAWTHPRTGKTRVYINFAMFGPEFKVWLEAKPDGSASVEHNRGYVSPWDMSRFGCGTRYDCAIEVAGEAMGFKTGAEMDEVMKSFDAIVEEVTR